VKNWHLSDEAFVKVWNAARSRAELIEKFGVAMNTLNSRASTLRQLGHPLKKLRPVAGRPGVPTARFIRAWNAAGSVAEVADRFGLKPASVKTRAGTLRRHGAPIKRFHTTRPPVPTETFVRVWNAARTKAEVARRLDMNPAYLHVKAHELRGRGYQLKKFTAQRPPEPIAA
jgi:hypothetical protein